MARAARGAGHDVFVLLVDGVSDADYSDFETGRTALTTVGRAISELRRARCRDLVVVGNFTRPDHARLEWDWGTLKIMPRLLQIRFGGDDRVNSIVSSLFEAQGFRVLPPLAVAPGLAAPAGLAAGRKPSKEEEEDIALGLSVLASLGAFDVGQALVVSHRRVLAIEAAEGTDAMIARCGELRRNGRFREAAPSGVLVKAAKPGQDLRMDLPTVGTRTVEAAVAAGLAGLALHADHVLMPDGQEMLDMATRQGLFVVTVDMPASAGPGR
ncbi:UDP-2,3-diacylglucosamine pyrophosphatase [Lutibaculum baratangense AMV1]|uniref:UDP-2,3-diacylglucosamine pyrophosphatase n=1 Tax=Lutibaculum baratangense AMV1 TaxID=631454 RepID=V4RDN0_9HYPH|nr:UDP-2,3-diacylglucosamine pyrophosphatase [Lutibaculum baratangense AMV1]